MIIQFKTIEPYFTKERLGLKSNTVRKVEDSDSRFDALMEMIQTGDYCLIRIMNPKDDTYFERQITDITYFDERFIISWKHEDLDNLDTKLEQGETK